MVMTFLLASCGSSPSTSTSDDMPTADTTAGEQGPVAITTKAKPPMQAAAVVEELANTLTGPQNNATRSAQQYIGMSGFSQTGLIDQLSSDAGEGYDVADSTAAVDSLNIDWDAEAVESAKQYLDMSGFSCNGLIEQLSSSAGDKYTVRQATYGAQQAGAC
jgi:Host cell surface-exposed lipoprotein